MPLPKPKPNEATSVYISRCVSFVNDEGTTGAQAVAMCYSAARQAGRTVPKPKKEELLEIAKTVGITINPDEVLKLIEEDDEETVHINMAGVEQPTEAPLERPLPSVVSGNYPELDESIPLPPHLRSREFRPDELEEELKKP